MYTVNTHVYFPKDIYDDVTLLAQEETVSVAEKIRQLVIEGLSKTKAVSAKGAKNQKSSSVDYWDKLLEMNISGLSASSDHDKYLYN